MSNEELFYALLNVCDRARRLNKSQAEIIGCLETVKATEVQRSVAIKVEAPAIVTPNGLPQDPFKR